MDRGPFSCLVDDDNWVREGVDCSLLFLVRTLKNVIFLYNDIEDIYYQRCIWIEIQG